MNECALPHVCVLAGPHIWSVDIFACWWPQDVGGIVQCQPYRGSRASANVVSHGPGNSH